MKNLTAVDYVKDSISQDFGSGTAIISTWFENRMDDLAEEWIPIACEEQVEFQATLELLVYPFLACYKALLDSDVSDVHAGNYCQRIWSKMPVDIIETALASV